jgi:hypothetical protein
VEGVGVACGKIRFFVVFVMVKDYNGARDGADRTNNRRMEKIRGWEKCGTGIGSLVLTINSLVSLTFRK